MDGGERKDVRRRRRRKEIAEEEEKIRKRGGRGSTKGWWSSSENGWSLMVKEIKENQERRWKLRGRGVGEK